MNTLIICLVCLFSSFAGVILAITLKGKFVMDDGLEAAHGKMFGIGVGAFVLALVLSVIGIFIP